MRAARKVKRPKPYKLSNSARSFGNGQEQTCDKFHRKCLHQSISLLFLSEYVVLIELQCIQIPSRLLSKSSKRKEDVEGKSHEAGERGNRNRNGGKRDWPLIKLHGTTLKGHIRIYTKGKVVAACPWATFPFTVLRVHMFASLLWCPTWGSLFLSLGLNALRGKFVAIIFIMHLFKQLTYNYDLGVPAELVNLRARLYGLG